MPRVIEDQLGRPVVLASSGYVIATRPAPARCANVRANFAVARGVDWTGPNIGTVPIGLPVGSTPVLSGLGADDRSPFARSFFDVHTSRGTVDLPWQTLVALVAGGGLGAAIGGLKGFGVGAGLAVLATSLTRWGYESGHTTVAAPDAKPAALDPAKNPS